MEHDESIKLYGEALDRLVSGKPIRVEKGTKITNNAVSLEAGRSKGSIKKSRTGYADLIARIDAATEEQAKPKREAADRALRMKGQVSDLEERLDAALGREMSLVYELFEVRQKLAKLTGDKVVPIRREKPIKQS